MMDERIYIAISLVVLIVVAALVIVVNRRLGNRRLTPLAGIAFAFVLAGIAFGADQLVGYGLMAVGVVFAIIDIIRNLKQK